MGPVRDVQGVANIVVRDEHTDPRIRELAHDVLDLVHRDRVDAREGLVEQEEFRVEGEGARDFRAAALAAGERVGFLPAAASRCRTLRGAPRADRACVSPYMSALVSSTARTLSSTESRRKTEGS